MPPPQATAWPGRAPAAPPPQPSGSIESRYAIPTGYGDDRIVLMVRDPWWLYAYWEIQSGTERRVRSQLVPHEVIGLHSILRVYDVTEVDFPSQPAHQSFDIPLSGLATNWYIQTNAPHRDFIVDIGLLTQGGKFLLLARSNRVRTPRFGPSDVIDDAWMLTDEAYWRLFGSSTGIGIGSSQAGWSALLTQQLSSGGWSSGSLFAPQRQAVVRGFWCRLNTDLVIHGATEPRSTVMIQGQPVAVRKDGTFSLRLALPDGTQQLVIEVTSADGRQARTMTPIVTLAWSGTLGTEAPPVKAGASQPLVERP